MKYNNRFYKIEDLVNSSFHDPSFNIASISAHFDFSRTTLHRVIKKGAGMSASNYLNSIRLTHAHMILSSEDTTITETAKRVGYLDPKYFSKLFKRKFGILPTEL